MYPYGNSFSLLTSFYLINTSFNSGLLFRTNVCAIKLRCSYHGCFEWRRMTTVARQQEIEYSEGCFFGVFFVFLIERQFKGKGTLLVRLTAYCEICSVHLTHPWGAVGSHSAAPGDQLQFLSQCLSQGHWLKIKIRFLHLSLS